MHGEGPSGIQATEIRRAVGKIVAGQTHRIVASRSLLIRRVLGIVPGYFIDFECVQVCNSRRRPENLWLTVILSLPGDMDVTGDSEKSRNRSTGDKTSKPPEKTMKETVDPKQLEPIASKYEEAVSNNVAALFAEDAVFVTEHGTFNGPEAIEKGHVDVFKEWRFSNHLIKTAPNSYRIIGTAENIASNGEWSQTLQGQVGGPIQRKGYWSAIDTREGNDWKILMLTVNVTPAPSSM